MKLDYDKDVTVTVSYDDTGKFTVTDIQEKNPMSKLTIKDLDDAVAERFQSVDNEIECIAADAQETYQIFKQKDKKVRARVKRIEDDVAEKTQQLLEVLALIGQRLDALENPKAPQTGVQGASFDGLAGGQIGETTPYPMYKSDALREQIRGLNEMIFGGSGGYDGINLGTLRSLAKYGLVSGTVKEII